ncbi:bifunctional folylpolyglutamate synthase/dihydrofolate synthase [Bombilactobacillus thymidiniphilus]|uniref:tetrahydrofolate synthase n=1 Tax=Bombilactobacillus thymidiniphilus TaxID=2923363 RepID=A0ABY4PE66_9LACO|nr:Mur ligase family protein [Bombilactobacillus thymidiniphilus]UQS83827.1 Mur ligase family protein [Bombilactobacillus thymidiniphilus]
MNYQETLQYIHHLPHLHADNSLFYVKKVLTALDDPQNKAKLVHITGTNGKGTTGYYLTQLLVKNGAHVATFASPYVQKFNERFLLDGQEISDEQIVSLAKQVITVVQQIKTQDSSFCLVEFEFLVVMMFLFCVQENVDYGIIEVGIGGQHDKTNVFTPELSIITNVGLDHVDLIGPTLLDIANEKAGVIKSNRPVVVGQVDTPIKTFLKQEAAKLTAPAYFFDEDYFLGNIKPVHGRKLKFTWHNKNYQFRNITFNSWAHTQLLDFAIALEAFSLLQENHLNTKVVHQVAQLPGLPARLQLLATDPLIVVDGAHNEPAIKALVANLQPLAKNRRVVVLYAAMVDKDRKTILKLLRSFAQELIVTSLSEARGAKNSDYDSSVNLVTPWQVAFAQALQSLDGESILVICGSLHFAGEILNFLE